MKVADHLAHSLGRRDEVPNVELAEKIARRKDADAVNQLIALVQGKDKHLQSNAIKTLDETGARCPELIAPHLPVLVALLRHKSNRVAWGAMAAISAVTEVEPQQVKKHLPAILEGVERGTVIHRDEAVRILVKLAALPRSKNEMVALLLEITASAPYNQFVSYASSTAPLVQGPERAELLRIIRARLPEFTHLPKIRNLNKLINRLTSSK